MLDDRDYMRQPEYRDPMFRGFHWSWTVILLLAYAAIYLAELVVGKAFPDSNFFFGHIAIQPTVQLVPGYMALSLEGLQKGYLWQLVTYQFMHAGFLHLFLNSWAIYVFGRELESTLGARRYLALVFSSGIVGGVFQVLSALLAPGLFGGEVVGASACAFGLVAAYATLFPERELTLLIFFVFPATVRARVLLMVSVALAVAALVLGIFVKTDNVANAAHLGGMAMGWFFVRKILQGNWTGLSGAMRPAEASQPRRPKLEPSESKGDTEFLEGQVDPILDKISAHGIGSLTAREREILEAARKKMSRT